MQLLLFSRWLIVVTCTILVLWQGSQSIIKYLGDPQSTAYTLGNFADQEIMPILTICQSEYFTENAKLELERCGM